MEKLFFDACSLIYLTKIKLKEKLPLLGEIIVSDAVKKELLRDSDKFEDAKILKANIDKKLINLTKMKIKNIFKNKSLGKGEKSTIEICLKNEGIFITDDHQALNFALGLGLETKTSEIILTDLLEKSIINHNQFTKNMSELARIKSLSPEIVEIFEEKAQNLKYKKRSKK